MSCTNYTFRYDRKIVFAFYDFINEARSKCDRKSYECFVMKATAMKTNGLSQNYTNQFGRLCAAVVLFSGFVVLCS